MDPKKSMFESIEHIALEVLELQNELVKLRRESEELHVMPEHKAKLESMKTLLTEIYKRSQDLQDFLLSSQRKAEHPKVNRSVMSDVWL
jgi:hypothetical protein